MGKPAEDEQSRPACCLIFQFLNRVVAPAALIVFVPNLILALWFSVTVCGGSFTTLFSHFSKNHGIIPGMMAIWKDTPIASNFSLMVVGGYCLFALTLMVLLPGKRIEGPQTPNGNVPVYKNNGFFCYVVTMITFFILTYYLKSNGMTPTIVYDRFNEILATLNLFSLVFCLFLYLKGIYYPSSTDNSSSGNFIFDYYWGTELYPRIFGIDVKVFTNCRFGMTIWALLVCVFWLKSYEQYGFQDNAFVTMFLQMLYITKFFWWEGGYYQTLDIILDRAGFYICWGCLCFITGFYTSVSMYTAGTPVNMGWYYNGFFLLLGLFSLTINYQADKQRQDVRRSNGQVKVWGRRPSIIHAKYSLSNGKVRESILLTNGWWGLSRHFHYLPELMLAFCWSATSGFQHLLPFSYFIFLLVLLVHRSYRDDEKCSKKYGKYWVDYQKKVPYKIIPYVF